MPRTVETHPARRRSVFIAVRVTRGTAERLKKEAEERSTPARPVTVSDLVRERLER